LTGVLRALVDLPLGEDILIRSDSAYALGTVTTWMHGWKKRGWKKPDGAVPSNLEIVKALDLALSARDGATKFEKVKGHSGDLMNEAADALCGRCSAEARAGQVVSVGPGWSSAQGSSAREHDSASVLPSDPGLLSTRPGPRPVAERPTLDGPVDLRSLPGW
jgi:ribonuclease HI